MKFFSSIINNRFLSLLFICIVTLLAYSNTFNNGFVLDDDTFIVDWPLIQNITNLPRFFSGFISPLGHPGTYSPVKTLIHCLNYQFFGGVDPMGHHIVALLIHLLGTIVVYRITLLLVKHNSIAFLTGLLFGLHPVHVESITYLSSSADTLGIIFLLVSFYFYLKSFSEEGSLLAAREEKSNGFPAWSKSSYYKSLIFAILAVFTNEQAFCLPLILFLYEGAFNSQKARSKTVFSRVLPFVIIIAVYVLVKWQATGAFTRQEYLFDNSYLTFMYMIKAWTKYMGLLLFPVILNYNHMISPGIFSFHERDFDVFAVLSQNLLEVYVLISLIVIVGVIYVALKMYRSHPLVSFAVGWFILSLLPVANIIPSLRYFSESFLYLGSFAFCLLLGYILQQIFDTQVFLGKDESDIPIQERRGRWVCIILVVGLVSFYSARTYVRNQDWKNQVKILQATVNANPLSAQMHSELGLAYHINGNFDQAWASFRQASALRPNDPHHYFVSEETLSQMERYDESIRVLKKAISLDPRFSEAYFNLAGLYAHLDEEDKAFLYLEKAMESFKSQGKLLEAGEYSAALVKFIQEKRAANSAQKK